MREPGLTAAADPCDSIERTRADYGRWLEARYAAARGHVDAVIDPRDSRRALILALAVSL